MLQRLRHRRAIAFVAALLLLGSGLLSVAHTHASDRAEQLVGWFSRVPLSVVSGPDAPSPGQHWHAGTTFDSSRCAVCMLLHQPGATGDSGWVGSFTAVAWTIGATPRPDVDPLVCPPSARAPPLAS